MINHEFLKCKGKGYENEMQLFLILAVACIFSIDLKWGIIFLINLYFIIFSAISEPPMESSSKDPVLGICRYPFYYPTILKNHSIFFFSSEIHYGKLIFRPEDQNTTFLVRSRPDKQGNRHQILYDVKFVRILKEAEKQKDLDSESEVEGLYATSDEEAEEQRWEEWMRPRRVRRKSFSLD